MLGHWGTSVLPADWGRRFYAGFFSSYFLQLEKAPSSLGYFSLVPPLFSIPSPYFDALFSITSGLTNLPRVLSLYPNFESSRS